MVQLASAKMPDAHLYQGDFSKGLAESLLLQKYDFIVATYSMHHLSDQQKIVFLHSLQDCLKEHGKILIGDIVFENRNDLEQCRQMAGNAWDDDEIYFVIDELRNTFPDLAFTQVSYCAGVLTTEK
jgi:putative AdoMet-dependent methyltransferase